MIKREMQRIGLSAELHGAEAAIDWLCSWDTEAAMAHHERLDKLEGEAAMLRRHRSSLRDQQGATVDGKSILDEIRVLGTKIKRLLEAAERAESGRIADYGLWRSELSAAQVRQRRTLSRIERAGERACPGD